MIKTWLVRVKGIWPDKLPGILWAYKTTTHTPIGETPFCLTYEHKVVIPREVGLTSHDEGKNEEAIRLQLDLLEEVRATAE